MSLAKKSALLVGGEEDDLTSAVPPVQEMPANRPVEKQRPPPPEPTPVVRAQREDAGKQVIDPRREGVEVSRGVFRLNRFVDGAEYIDALNGRYIVSIGRNVHDGRIEASVDARYYGDMNWECLFLR